MSVIDALASGLAAPLSQLRSRWLASPLPGWLSAWFGGLALWLPERWRELLRVDDNRIWLLPEGDGWRVRSGASNNPSHELTIPAGTTLSADDWPRHSSRWVLLPADSVLRRELRLPLAAAERLRDVVRHQIDRETPFTAEQAAFDARVLGRDESGKQLRIELVVVPKTMLDRALASVAGIGASVGGVDVRDDSGEALGLNLLPTAQRERRRDATVSVNLALAAFGALALIFAFWQTLENRRAAVAALEAQVDEQRQAARRVSALRDRLSDAVEGANFLAQARSERGRSIDLLNDLSRRLPDGTWLERVNVADGRVVVTGFSNQASALVGGLQDSPYLRAPALAGSVQPDPRSGRDRFTLTAELASSAAAGATP